MTAGDLSHLDPYRKPSDRRGASGHARVEDSFHQGWVALSDRGLLNPAATDALLHQGLFVMELALPLQSASLLLDHQSNVGWPHLRDLP